MKCIILILLIVGLSAEEQEAPAAKWTQYARAGLSQDQSVNGGHAYYRLNRRSPVTFRDLRLFGYGLGDDSYIYIRYKSSMKYRLLVALQNRKGALLELLKELDKLDINVIGIEFGIKSSDTAEYCKIDIETTSSENKNIIKDIIQNKFKLIDFISLKDAYKS